MHVMVLPSIRPAARCIPREPRCSLTVCIVTAHFLTFSFFLLFTAAEWRAPARLCLRLFEVLPAPSKLRFIASSSCPCGTGDKILALLVPLVQTAAYPFVGAGPTARRADSQFPELCKENHPDPTLQQDGICARAQPAGGAPWVFLSHLEQLSCAKPLLDAAPGGRFHAQGLVTRNWKLLCATGKNE